MKSNRILYTVFVFCFALAACHSSKKEEPSAQRTNPNGRDDAWGYVGYGGGGAMFFPAVSPFDPNYAFVACDMTGSYVTYNGGDSWRMFNLRGPSDYFVFDPLDSNTVYANSIALFKSSDRGHTWSLLYPTPSETLGVVSKGDHASEYVVTRDSTRRSVLAFAVDPDDSKKLYAAISIDKALSLYTSNDGGLQWSKEKDLEDGAQDVYVVPSSPAVERTIYITGKNSVTIKENGTWKINKAPAGVSKLTHFAGGFDKPNNKFILYAISGKSYFNPEGDPSGIYYSENGGATWENREQGLTAFTLKGSESPEWRTIATSAQHPEVIYVSYNSLKVHADTTCIGVAKSEDYGKTWTLAWKDKLTKPKNIPSSNMETEWLNERFGPTWGENPFSIGVSPVDPRVCYATDFGRTLKTFDGGRTWQQAYTNKKEGAGWMSRGLEVTTGYAVVFDPFDTSHVFIANTDIGLMESVDGGESWGSATQHNGVPRAWENSTYALAFDPEVKGRAWAAMSGTHDLPRPKMWRKKGIAGFTGGILLTDDGGKTWQPQSSEIGEAAMTHVLIDPSSNKDARTLYACAFGKGVYKSVDGGKTWQQKNKGITGSEPFAWRITRRDKDGTLFLIISRRNERGGDKESEEGIGALYRSDDGAETWTRMNLPSGTNAPMSLMIDREEGNKILLSAWGRDTDGKFSPDTGGGIFLSIDDGKTWNHVLQQDQHIHDITYEPRTNTYYACGFNGSAYRSGDDGATWKRLKGFNFKWGKRVDIDPRNPDHIFIVTFGGGIWSGPAQGDPQAVEDIVTPVVAYP